MLIEGSLQGSAMRAITGVCCAAVALLVVAAGIARAADMPRVVSLKVCIDGLDNLHVKDGQLTWEHLAYERPGIHSGCKGVSEVNGVHWGDGSKSFPLPVPSGSARIAFHPVRCRGNCVLVQSPSAANGWEAIYQFDDYVLPSSAVYCVNIVIGGRPESAADQSVQHIRPAPLRAGGKPLFDGLGGKLHEGACAEDLVS
jgi:hypothetical protein